MKLSERFRRFWLSGAGADHALSEQEREWTNEHSANVFEELATTAELRVGNAFDPDTTKGA